MTKTIHYATQQPLPHRNFKHRTCAAHLVAYLKTGPTANHPGAWRHPEAPLDDILRPERYEHIARVLEEARFDACFYADTFGLPDIHGGNFDAYLRLGGQTSYLDPLVVLPVMARALSGAVSGVKQAVRPRGRPSPFQPRPR